MDSILKTIVDAIGELKDSVDDKSWEICEAVSDAFEELGAYSRDLLPALKSRLNVSKTQLYNYQHAWDLRSEVGNDYDLPFSHFAVLHTAKRVYELDNEQVKDLLAIVKEDGLSTEDLRVMCNNMFNEDYVGQTKRRFEKLAKTMRLCYEEMSVVDYPDILRPAFYSVLRNLEGWVRE